MKLNKKGQGLVEYLIIVALIAVSTIGVVRFLGHTLQGKLANVVYSLQGGKAKKARIEHMSDDIYKRKDLSNFLNGSMSNGKKK